MNQVENLIFKLANEVLEATNQISARFEEGVSVLLGEIGPRATVDGHDGMFSDDQQNTAGNMEEMELDVDGMDEEEIESFLQHQMMHNSPLEGIADSVISDIVSRQVGPSTPTEHFHAFCCAITWSEPFILSLLAFQLFMFMMSMQVSRKSRSLTSRLCVMISIAILVRSAEWLNGLGAQRWRHFATQNYFDKKGIFVAVMLCGPLLLDSFVMLIRFVLEASQLLVKVKKEELKRKKKNSTLNERTTDIKLAKRD